MFLSILLLVLLVLNIAVMTTAIFGFVSALKKSQKKGGKK